MPIHQRSKSPALGLWGCGVVIALLISFTAARADTTVQSAPVETSGTSVATSNDISRLITLQSELLAQLQVQQQATVEALEGVRRDVSASLATSVSDNAAQFARISESLAQQRAQDLRVVRNSNRLLMAVVIGFSAWLLLSILFLNLACIRALNRLTTVFSTSANLPGTEAQALADARAASRQLLLFPGEEGQRQLGNAVLQLQSRIETIEQSVSKARYAPRPPGPTTTESLPPTTLPAPSPSG